jgi:hypothetical protein
MTPKEEYYRYGESLGISINDLQRLKMLADNCQEDMADESIKFAEWINKNDYEKINGDRWCKKFMSYTHSTSEMYKIYIGLQIGVVATKFN